MTTPGQLNASPLQLNEYDFEEIHLVANKIEDDKEEGPSSLTTQRSIHRHPKKERQFKLDLIVNLGSEDETSPPAYNGQIRICGYFSIHPNYSDDLHQLILVTGASILYGSCREMVANLTARSSHGMMTLPSVSFVPMLKKKAAKKTTRKKTSVKQSNKKKS